MSAILLTIIALTSGPYENHFNKANQAYNQQNYTEAIQLYEQLITEGVSAAPLFYNLANAYYRQKNIPAAIANYERALRLDPSSEDVKENLDHCIRLTERKLQRPLPPDWEQSLLFWHYNVSPTTSTNLAIILWVIFWTTLCLIKIKPMPYLRTIAAITLVLAVMFAVSAWAKAHPTTMAVAAKHRVPVRYGVSEQETTRFELYAGDRVNIDSHKNGWTKITTGAKEKGWVKNEDLYFVGPPYAAYSQEPAS